MKEVEKVWGKEQIIVNTPEYCGKLLRLRAGYRSSLHYHKIKDETFYVLDGAVLMETYGSLDPSEQQKMYRGDIVHIPPGMMHRFTGLKDSNIIEFSTHDDPDDSIRVALSAKVKK